MKKGFMFLILFLICAFMTSCGKPSGNLAESSLPAPQGTDNMESTLEEESWEVYSHDGVSYEINSRCTGEESHVYRDDEKFVSYMITVFPSMTNEEALSQLTDVLSTARIDENFKSFQSEHTDSDWVDLAVNSGAVYQYNAMFVSNKDGGGTGVAVVRDDNTAVQVLVEYPSKEAGTYAKSELDHILRSLSINQAAHGVVAENTIGTQPEWNEGSSQTIGTDEFGHVTIPATWVRFRDLDGGTDLQYSDPQGNSIITLNIFSDDGLTEEQKAKVTAETAASSVWYNLEQNEVQEIEGAQVTLGKYNAFQIYGFFISEDHSLPSMIVCWIFEDENNVLHYISAEEPIENGAEAVSYIENSYTLP